MTQEALKLALDALIWTTGSGDFGEGGQAHEGAKKCLFPAIAAIKEALAQTQEPDVQETLHWHAFNYRQAHTAQAHEMWLALEQFVESKTKQPAQRTWVGLTEQQRNDIEDVCEMIIGKPAFDAIEAKLKEKNTQERNFCSRCGKRTADLTTIHTCTPPQD